MKQLLVRVMLICSTAVTTVFADPLDAGLDADRSSLSRQQIAARSASLEASTSLSPLRFPQALSAPRRIFNPDIWRSIEAAADAHDLDPMILAGMIFIESDGDPLAKKPERPGRDRAADLGIGSRPRPWRRARRRRVVPVTWARLGVRRPNGQTVKEGPA